VYIKGIVGDKTNYITYAYAIRRAVGYVLRRGWVGWEEEEGALEWGGVEWVRDDPPGSFWLIPTLMHIDLCTPNIITMWIMERSLYDYRYRNVVSHNKFNSA